MKTPTKAMTKSKVLTANRLGDGIAVWLGPNEDWLESIEGAFVARDDDAAASLEDVGRRAAAANHVVDVNLIDVEDKSEGILPVRLRERIRAFGPTIDYLATADKPAA